MITSDINLAIESLKGNVIAIPTETVYGLAECFCRIKC